MTLIREASDIHLEFNNKYRLPALPTDKDTILVLAGDICVGRTIAQFFPFFEDISKRFKAVVYVFGNHEYYGKSIHSIEKRIKDRLAVLENVHVFAKGSVIIDDVAFICVTLWTNMNKRDPFSLWCANQGMNDFKKIRIGTYGDPYKRKFTAFDSTLIHDDHLKFIAEELTAHKDKKRVVVTHHLPTILSVADDYRNNKLNDAYYSDLSEFIFEHKPPLWFHGHSHSSSDYIIGETRVVANPKGYATAFDKNYEEIPQNVKYNPTLLIEI